MTPTLWDDFLREHKDKYVSDVPEPRQRSAEQVHTVQLSRWFSQPLLVSPAAAVAMCACAPLIENSCV